MGQRTWYNTSRAENFERFPLHPFCAASFPQSTFLLKEKAENIPQHSLHYTV